MGLHVLVMAVTPVTVDCGLVPSMGRGASKGGESQRRAANILELFPADPSLLYAECRRALDVLASWAEEARTLAEVLGYTR